MADVDKTIEIIFQGTDRLSSTLNTLGGKVSSAASTMEDFGQPFADATEKIALLSAAMAGVAVAGIKMSNELENESKKMAASLGLPTEEANKFKAVAEDVYTSGYGDDLASSFDAVTAAQKKFGDEAGVDIGKVTTQALQLQKTFGTDYADSLSAAKTLMKNFGISSEEAFGFIAKGMQDNLNGSGDFLDSINEYSTQFKAGGASAEQFYSVMKTGYQEGVLGTDKAADAFKEFRLRIQDGSELTRKSLLSIGIDEKELQANLNSGAVSAIDAFGTIIKKLNETDDASTKLNAGTGLLGTQFEDLGTEAALSLTTATDNIGGFSKALQDIDMKTTEEKITSAWRTIASSFANIEIWEKAKAKLVDVFGDIADVIPEAFENVDFSALEDTIGKLWNDVGKIFSQNNVDLTTVEGMQSAIQKVVDSFTSVANVANGIVEVFTPIVGGIISVIDEFNKLDEETKEIIGNLLAVGTAVAAFGTSLKVIGSLTSPMVSLGSSIVSVSGSVLGLTSSITTSLLPSFVALAKANPFAALTTAATAGYALGTSLRKLVPSIDTATQKMFRWVDSIVDFTGTKGNVDLEENLQGINTQVEKLPKEKTIKVSAAVDSNKVAELQSRLNLLSDEKQVIVKPFMDKGLYQIAEGYIDKLEQEKDIPIKTTIDEPALESSINYIETTLEDGTKVRVKVGADTSELKKDVEEIKKEVDPLKLLAIKAKIDEESIKATTTIFTSLADVAAKGIEWEAKIDIAAIQADSEKVVSAFNSVGNSVVAVSDSVATMFSSLASTTGSVHFYELFEVLDREMDLQEELIAAQIRLIDAQSKSMERGDPVFTIKGENVSTGARVFMMDVLKEIQVEMSTSNAAYLMGTT